MYRVRRGEQPARNDIALCLIGGQDARVRQIDNLYEGGGGWKSLWHKGRGVISSFLCVLRDLASD